ncbi:MAG: tetratricopeptide repeat protein [Leptolyngbyaceae bacterium]|nr:tetratricopeptide repeat protein [Leptolyngbyaceae bacterium]
MMKHWIRWKLSAIAALAIALPAGFEWSGLGARPAHAQDSAFPPNPLIFDEADPLLPQGVVDRPLSEQERNVLNAALNELAVDAETEFNQGNIAGAFDLWFRELRLRRALGSREEVAALNRVGTVAWNESQTTEVRLITERLLEIEQQAQAEVPVDYELLLAIAEAYQTVRARNYAVALYDQILVQARLDGNPETEEQALRALGDLHLAWFDYPQAAAAYQELLAFLRAKGDKPGEIEALRQLAFIYDEGNEPVEAIAIRQDLISIFESRNELTEIPALKLAIADDYREIGRPDLAAPTYQETFAIARSVQYYGYAREALANLAALYVDEGRPDDALVVYQLVLDVGQQSYDYYGRMDTYDRIAQIHKERGATDRALVAYRQALAIAQQLDFRVDYFNEQIAQLRR